MVEATFEAYATRRLPAMLATARAISGERHLAEDLVQDVLIKLHAGWDRISRADSVDAYVHRMLVNELLSWRRKWARVVPVADVRLRDIPTDHGTQFAERDALLRDIAALPDRQRVVVGLRYLADLSDAEIAAALGCTQSTVRVHAARALAALRVRTDHDPIEVPT